MRDVSTARARDSSIASCRFGWKEVMPPAGGAGAVAQENLDEDSSLLQLRWYYTKKRAL